MKIVAETTTRFQYTKHFLVEMTEDEIKTVSQSNKTAEIGAECDVSAAWRDLRNFRAAKEQIEKAAETLKACAQLSITASAAYVIMPEPTAESPQ